MSPIKQYKARNAAAVRSETVTFRLDERLKFLADLAARSQGRKLGNFVEAAVEKALESVFITDERESNAGTQASGQAKTIHGKTLAELADSLWSADEATRFLNVAENASWLLSEGEHKLLMLLHHSHHYCHIERGIRILIPMNVKMDWHLLAAIRDGEADLDILPKEHRPKTALKFGWMTEKERIELYRADPAKYKRESEAFDKALRGLHDDRN